MDGDQVELYETLVSQAVDHFGKENGPAGFKVEMTHVGLILPLEKGK